MVHRPHVAPLRVPADLVQADPALADLLEQTLRASPPARPTSSALLSHEFFRVDALIQEREAREERRRRDEEAAAQAAREDASWATGQWMLVMEELRQYKEAESDRRREQNEEMCAERCRLATEREEARVEAAKRAETVEQLQLQLEKLQEKLERFQERIQHLRLVHCLENLLIVRVSRQKVVNFSLLRVIQLEVRLNKQEIEKIRQYFH